MRNLRKNIATVIGKRISSILLILILLNNIMIPEMERFHPEMEIENNSAGLIEILVEDVVDSDLFETDEHDDSSDNLVDGIQKFLSTVSILPVIHKYHFYSENQSIYPKFRLVKGFYIIDTPPPQFV